MARNYRTGLHLILLLSPRSLATIWALERLAIGLLNRNTYHSHILEFRGEFFRFRHGLEQHKQQLDASRSRPVDPPQKLSWQEKRSVEEPSPPIHLLDNTNNLS